VRRPKNPYPGVCKVVDRHGKVRWRFRSKKKQCYLHGEYGSAEFRSNYYAAVNDVEPIRSVGAVPGTFKWLSEQYRSSIRYHDLAVSSKQVLSRELDWLNAVVGDLPFASFKSLHVEAVMSRKPGPAAANRVKKNLGRLFNFAIKHEMGIKVNPARLADSRKVNADGFYTWTDEDIEAFQQRHPTGSKARLALELALNTGAARQDLARLGWSNIKGDSISYTRGKTGISAELPILPGLKKELSLIPKTQFLFLTHTNGQAYKSTTLGNWFKDRTTESGLKTLGANIHGLRKAGATRLAEHGATDWEIAAYLAHKDTKEASVYVQAVDRSLLGKSGMAKL
jgi:integrase